MQGAGGRLKREGMYVYIELIQVVVQQKLTQHCKVIMFQLKNKNPEFSPKKRDHSSHAGEDLVVC